MLFPVSYESPNYAATPIGDLLIYACSSIGSDCVALLFDSRVRPSAGVIRSLHHLQPYPVPVFPVPVSHQRHSPTPVYPWSPERRHQCQRRRTTWSQTSGRMSVTSAAAHTSMQAPCSTTSSPTRPETSGNHLILFRSNSTFLQSRCYLFSRNIHKSYLCSLKTSILFLFPKLRCDFCSKPYTNYMSLRNHMRIHGQKRYMCDLCGKAFRLARYLRNHQRIHDDGPNRFDCPSCCKSYRTMLELAQHRCTAAASNQVCKMMW